MRLSKNFTQREFKSKDGASMPEDVLNNVQELACNLQTLRDFLDEPVKVTSGWRSPSHNKAIGGVKNSQHVLGKASDLKVKGIEPEDLYLIIESLITTKQMKEGGLGLYNTFVHYDIRGTKARWDKRDKENFY